MTYFKSLYSIDMNTLKFEAINGSSLENSVNPNVTYNETEITYDYDDGTLLETFTYNGELEYFYEYEPEYKLSKIEGSVTFASYHWRYYDFDIEAYVGGMYIIKNFSEDVSIFSGRTSVEVSSLIFAGDDQINGSGKADYLLGYTGMDTLRGDGGADTLDGGFDEDIMLGGTGNDLYIVDNDRDVVWEYKGEGYDAVESSVSYILGLHVEKLTLTGGEDTDGYGNDLFNELIGNGGRNFLVGAGGNDTMNGGGGADTMDGGAGSDIYYVNMTSDYIVEAGGNGTDTVAASATYALNGGDSIEILRTTSSRGLAPINLTGNPFAQTITGNAGSNVLHDGGGGAADKLQGLDGNDTYRIFNAGDVIIETATQGTADLVMAAVDYTLTAGAHIERLATNATAGTSGIDLTGNELAQEVVGNSGSNILKGMGGDDILKGLTGKDTLTGGTGADTFVFSTALGAANVDTITDYSVASDTIQLENAYFSALTATGVLAAGSFRSNLTGIAADSSDRIIYEADTGKLFYDADANGSGAGIHFATLTANLSINSADFVVI